MNQLPDILSQACTSLARSLAYYWPADGAVNNLAVHVAYGFLNRGYVSKRVHAASCLQYGFSPLAVD